MFLENQMSAVCRGRPGSKTFAESSERPVLAKTKPDRQYGLEDVLLLWPTRPIKEFSETWGTGTTIKTDVDWA